MTGHRGTTDLRSRSVRRSIALRRYAKPSRALVRFGAYACALFLAVSAPAQEVANPSQIPSQAPSQPGNAQPTALAPNPAFKPGFIDAFGRWLDEGATKLKSDMQGAQEKVDKFGNQARDAAKDATGAVMGLPNARVVTGRERCAPAQNGGPDCQAAANTVCRGKGFQTGKSLDTQSEQKCPAKVLLEGRAPNASECPTEIFVTRAMCQ
jgi:hypothetical protein